jgi:hypothetical protein
VSTRSRQVRTRGRGRGRCRGREVLVERQKGREARGREAKQRQGREARQTGKAERQGREAMGFIGLGVQTTKGAEKLGEQGDAPRNP